MLHQQQLDIGLPCKRRAPRHLEIGSSDGDFHTSVEDHYRAVYYEALDLVTMGINNRFDQPGYKVYRNIEELILKECQGKEYEEELYFVCTHYKNDVNKYQLES